MSFQNANAKEPLINYEIPTLPWQIVGTDLFSLYGRDYVVVVDYYSRYPEVERLYATRSSAVIKKIKSILARQGKFQKMISDNGPQYISDEFAKFASEWEFNHTTSSPKHAQSTGLAERTVQTLKQLMKKAKTEHKDPYLSLLKLRNTPVDGLASLVQLSMSRRLRSAIPCTEKHLRPVVINPEQIEESFEQKQEIQKLYYDQSARPLPQFHEGEQIHIYKESPKPHWEPATVIKTPSSQMPRSYVVKTGSGRVCRRNRRHLRSSGIQNTGQDNILDSYEPSDISQKSSGSTSIPSQQSQSAPPPLQ